MKQSYINRIFKLEEKKTPKLFKPILILQEGDPEPENPEYYKIIRFVIIDPQVQPE